MKAVIPDENPSKPPHVVYWTGRVRLHVHIVTWCDQDRDASDTGVLQVSDDVKVCEECQEKIDKGEYPKPRR